jgi:hypothetical protein
MTGINMHRTPQLRDVIREQFQTTALSMRTFALIGIALGAVATVLAFADYFIRGVGTEFAPNLSLIPALAGGILPVVIWQRERHFDTGFLWTLPVDRTRNAFAKVIAGWLCIMIVAFAFDLWMVILALITKGNITGDELVRLLPPTVDGHRAIDPSLLQTVRWIPPRAFWLVPFTAATGTYVILSAVMLGLRYPFRWIIGAIAGGFLVAAVGQGVGSEALWAKIAGVIQPVMWGKYGLDTLLSARSESVHTVVALTTGQMVTVWKVLPGVSDWIVGTLIWTGIGLVLLAAAHFRHRERR